MSLLYQFSINFALLTLCAYQLIGCYDAGSNQCAEYNKICNPHLLQPCCDENSSCKVKKSRNDYVCGEKSELDGSCVSDEDCSEIQHAKCSEEKKCVCRPNNIRINDTHCAPPLGAFCWKDEKCATNNAVCIDNECQCNKQHIQNNNQCILIYLGIQCEGDSFCQRFINHSKCSESGKCVCDSNDYIIDNNACVPKFNAYCFTDEPCATHNAMCIDNKCQCKPNHIFRGSQCFPIHLFEECRTHRDCHEMEFAKCSDLHQCICRDTYLPINKSTCAPSLGAACSRNAPCIPKNLKCTQNKCQYPAKPIILSNEEPIALGSPCLKDINCIQNAICSSDKICICNTHFLASYKLTCEPTLYGFCTNDDQCLSHSFHCLNNMCQCKRGFTSVALDQCVETNSLYSCENKFECSDLWHSHCSNDGKCICKPNNVAISNSTCLPILDGHCWRDDQCTVENSFCSNYRCACKSNFLAVAKNQCISVDK